MTCLVQATIDKGAGRTKKAPAAFICKFDALQHQTGDDHFGSPAASVNKENELDRGSLQRLNNVSDDVDAALAQQQAG
jgi:hypothetical protein